MNKTYLVGYYGMKNTGDDALLTASILGAKRYLGSSSFIVSSPIPLTINYHGKTKPTLLDKQLYPAQNRLRQYWSALTSNNVIFGGGSVLQNQRDIDLKRDLVTLSGNLNNVALGIGIGPFENIKAERSCTHLLNSCRFVGVRDELSLDIAKSIAPRANVQLTFDLAPSLLSMGYSKAKHIERRGIAVCLCPHERLKGRVSEEAERIREIANALRLTHQATNEPIVFVDFNGHPNLGDKQVHQEVATLLKDIPCKHIQYDANPFRVLQRMSSYKAIVSMRLHASIFGFLAETPVISINYHEKCLGWCKQVGVPDNLHFSLDNTDRYSIAKQLCSGLQQGFSKTTMNIITARQNSIKNWSMANEHLTFKNISGHSFIQ